MARVGIARFRKPGSFWPMLLLALLCLIVFATVVPGLFLWDDQQFITENLYLKSWSGLPKLFTENLVAGAGITSNLYRPIQLLTHFFDWQLWGPWASGHRATNLVLAALTACALYALTRRFLGRPKSVSADWAAFFAVSLYVLHPLQSSSVGYISGRGDLLGLLFGSLSILLFQRQLALSACLMALAFLSKENTLVFPVLLLAYDFKRGNWKRHLPIWALAAAYVIARLTVLNFQDTLNFYGKANVFTENFDYRVYTFLSTIPKALELLVLPLGIHHERSWPVYATFWNGQVLLGLALIAALISVGVFTRTRRPLITIGIAWFLIAMLPTSNLLVMINAIFYDHWVLFPAFGICLAVADLFLLAIERFHFRPSTTLWAAALVPLIALTEQQNRVWQTPRNLYSWVLKFEPRSVKMLNNLAMVYATDGEHEKALELYRRAISISDQYAETHHNLALLELEESKRDAAVAELRRALDMNPRLYQSHTWLGKIYFDQADYANAAREFDASLAIHFSEEARVGAEEARRRRSQ